MQILIIITILMILFGLATNLKAGTSMLIKWSTQRPKNLKELIEIHAVASSIPKGELAAILFIESRGNPRAINPADPSFGIAQFTIATASGLEGRQVTKDDLFDAEFSIKLAAKFLRLLMMKYEVKQGLSFSEWAQAYNVGETKFDKGTRNPAYGARINGVFHNPQELAQLMIIEELGL